MAKRKQKGRSRSAPPKKVGRRTRGAQKQLKRTNVYAQRTRSGRSASQSKERVVNTPTRENIPNRRRGSTLGAKRRGPKKTPEPYEWTYIGNDEDEQNQPQKARPGDMVESDMQIFDRDDVACGTRFTFVKYEDGFIYGKVQNPHGRTVQFRRTAGHISVCHAEALEPNSGNLGSRHRRKKQTAKM